MVATKTFSFVSGAENLVGHVVSPYITTTYDGGEGNPAGALKFTVPAGTTALVGGGIDTYTIMLQSVVSQTWEDLGMLSTESVTGVVLESLDLYGTSNTLAAIPVGPMDDPHPLLIEYIEVNLVDTVGTPITSTVIASGGVESLRTESWETSTFMVSGNILPGYTAPGTEVRLQVKYHFILQDTQWYGWWKFDVPPVYFQAPQLWLDNIKLTMYGGNLSETPIDPPYDPPVDDTIIETDPSNPPLVGSSTLGTYNLDLYSSHRKSGIRESAKFVRIEKSATIDGHLVDESLRDIGNELSTDSAFTIINDLITRVQHQREQISWRVRDASL